MQTGILIDARIAQRQNVHFEDGLAEGVVVGSTLGTVEGLSVRVTVGSRLGVVEDEGFDVGILVVGKAEGNIEGAEADGNADGTMEWNTDRNRNRMRIRTFVQS